MPLPNPIRVRLAFAGPLLALMALLSCQNDSTGPKSSTSTVSTALSVDPVRFPDSVSWKAMGDSGTFKLTLTSDTSFSVQATLPQPLGSDTLTLSAWTLSSRTAEALFLSDAEGNLAIVPPSTKDSLSIRLLQAFDSLRTKSPAIWGSSADSKAVQIASLEKAYATLLLARDSAISGFPALHPFGIDSLAVVDQLLLLSAKDGYTYHTLDSLVPLDSTKLRTEVRALAVAGKLDSTAIFPLPPVGLSLGGILYILQLVEDSLTRLPVTLTGAVGDSATMVLVSGDTTLLASQTRTVHKQDTLLLQAKPDASGGPITVKFLLQSGTKTDTVTTTLTVAPRNRPPSFAGALSISRTFDTTFQTIPNWITAISPGPVNESGQKVHFEVVVDSGANFFSVPPSVDSTGTLRYQAKSVGRGVFQVRAHDNGDSTTGSSLNVSGWTTFSIQLFSRAVLAISGIPDTIRLVEDSATTLNIVAQNILGSGLAATFTPADTTLISVHSFALTLDATGKASFSLQAKTNVFGGPLLGVLKVTDSLDAISQGVYVVIAERNHPPSFGGSPSLVVTASAATRTFPGWLDSISAGPASESTQKVSFQVQVLSGSSLFAKAPSVDSTGTLSFAGNANSSGLAQIQVRAVDNDSLDPGNRYSAWKTASIYFNQPPILVLPTHVLSTWENQPATVGASTVSDQETSPANLSLTWTTSDSTILPEDSVFATFSGGSSRNITLHPLAHRWGAVRVVFTATDSLGATAADSLTFTVNPMNHAPVLTLKSPTLLATTWKGAQSFALAAAVWDDATPGQSGHFDLQLANAMDSVYLTSLSVDSAGTLHVSAKVDTAVSIHFQIRAHDNGGTANGGVDTSAWSSLQALQLVDTVLDAQGNSYRARRMPNGKVWMRSNLRTGSPIGSVVWADSLHLSGLSYTWAQAMNFSDTSCDTSTCPVSGTQQGICPTGWHVSDSAEWGQLVSAIGGLSGDSIGFQKLRADTGWVIMSNNMGIYFDTTRYLADDAFQFGIYPVQSWSPYAGNHNSVTYFGSAFWTNKGLMTFLNSLSMYQAYSGGGYGRYNSIGASIRCVQN